MKREIDDFLSDKERVCPECGKQFYRFSPDWAYKIGSGTHVKYYCSWTCLRKAETKVLK